MKQKQYSPLSVAYMAASLYAVENGYVDDIELDKVGDFESALHSYMAASQSELMTKIDESGDYDDDIEAKLKAAVDDFKTNHSW